MDQLLDFSKTARFLKTIANLHFFRGLPFPVCWWHANPFSCSNECAFLVILTDLLWKLMSVDTLKIRKHVLSC